MNDLKRSERPHTALVKRLKVYNSCNHLFCHSKFTLTRHRIRFENKIFRVILFWFAQGDTLP